MKKINLKIGRCARGLLPEAETEATGAETEASMNWSEARPRRGVGRSRDRGHIPVTCHITRHVQLVECDRK